jgi:hypothetical protein
VAEEASIPREGADTPLEWTISVDQSGALLVCTGTMAGRALEPFVVALDHLISSSATRVRVDLSEVEDWSPLAQAIILVVARRLGIQGRRLVLLKPSERLRRRTLLIDVFSLARSTDRTTYSRRSLSGHGEADAGTASPGSREKAGHGTVNVRTL